MALRTSAPGLDELLESVGRQLGTQLAQSLMVAVQNAVNSTSGRAVAAPPARRGPGRPRRETASSASACRVPNCTRPAQARSLCGSHYGKVARLKMNLGALTAADLKLLALDGRALRWAKKGSK